MGRVQKVITNERGEKILETITTFSETDHQTLEQINNRITKLESTLVSLKADRDKLIVG